MGPGPSQIHSHLDPHWIIWQQRHIFRPGSTRRPTIAERFSEVTVMPGMLNISCESDRDSLSVVTSTAGPNGSISPAGEITVTYGDDLTFTATPGTGYQVDTWSVDGEEVKAGGSTYTLSNIQAVHTVHVTFRLLPLLSDGPKLFNKSDLRGSKIAYIDQIIIKSGSQSDGDIIIDPIGPVFLWGTVLDINDAPVPNAQVTLAPSSWTGQFWEETDSNGHYGVLAVQGVYALTVTADGFLPYMEYPLNLVSWNTQKDIVLKPITPAP